MLRKQPGTLYQIVYIRSLKAIPKTGHLLQFNTLQFYTVITTWNSYTKDWNILIILNRWYSCTWYDTAEMHKSYKDTLHDIVLVELTIVIHDIGLVEHTIVI